MIKLLINALLVLGFVALILALVLGLSRLRAVEETDAAVDTMLDTENQAKAYAAEKEILDDSQVTVKVTETKETASEEESIAEKSTTTKTTTTSDDALVKGFLEGIE